MTQGHSKGLEGHFTITPGGAVIQSWACEPAAFLLKVFGVL